MPALKWKKAATPEELKRVDEIEACIEADEERSRIAISDLKEERSTIILRCNVRGWRIVKAERRARRNKLERERYARRKNK